LDIRKKNIIIN